MVERSSKYRPGIERKTTAMSREYKPFTFSASKKTLHWDDTAEQGRFADSLNWLGLDLKTPWFATPKIGANSELAVEIWIALRFPQNPLLAQQVACTGRFLLLIRTIVNFITNESNRFPDAERLSSLQIKRSSKLDRHGFAETATIFGVGLGTASCQNRNLVRCATLASKQK